MSENKISDSKSDYSFISVILPVFNEEKHIRGCLDSLVSQSYPVEFTEFIVVDGNSTDRTLEIVREYMGQYPVRILSNPARKTPVSLNMGIRASKGLFIVRCDAHARYPADYIERCIACLKETGADNVGGILQTRADGFTGNAIVKLLSSPFGVGNSAFRINNKSGYVDTVPFGAFRRSVFDTVGMFNEELLRSEDNDINARIWANGGKVFLSDSVYTVYYCRNTVSTLLKQALQNGNALFRTLKINPRAMKLRHYVPFLFLLSFILFPVLWSRVSALHPLYLTELSVYLILDLLFSFSGTGKRYGFITFWLFPLYHLTYGLGSFLGLLGKKLY